jgi:hypothetical protein
MYALRTKGTKELKINRRKKKIHRGGHIWKNCFPLSLRNRKTFQLLLSLCCRRRHSSPLPFINICYCATATAGRWKSQPTLERTACFQLIIIFFLSFIRFDQCVCAGFLSSFFISFGSLFLQKLIGDFCHCQKMSNARRLTNGYEIAWHIIR